MNNRKMIYLDDAIDALWKALYEYEDKTEKQFQESEDLDVGDWIGHRIFVQNMNDIDRQTILNLPPVQPEIIRCKDCIHRPIIDDPGAKDGFGLQFPDFRCPCRCADEYYSWMPNDNWFCGNGEKGGD